MKLISNAPNGFRDARGDPANIRKQPMVLGAKRDDWGNTFPPIHDSITGATYPLKN